MKFSTYILTGGNSTRMGTDKALQLYNKKTFIQHILSALETIDTSIKIVSSKLLHHNLGENYICDIKNNKGPVSGITSALKDSKTKWNLILSCDVPLLKNNFINWLITNHDLKYEATICLVNSKKMPLISIYHKQCESIFNKHLNNDQLRVMKVLEDLKVKYISVPKEFHKQLTNVNSIEQLKAISI